MKKVLFPLAILIFSCNQSGDKHASGLADSTATATAKAHVQTAAVSEPYFKAEGSGPEWNMVMEASSDGSFPVVLVDNVGGDELKGKLQKESLVVDGKTNVTSGQVKFSGSLESSLRGETVEISVVSTECTDAAGKKHSHSCVISIAGKKLKGCGEYTEL